MLDDRDRCKAADTGEGEDTTMPDDVATADDLAAMEQAIKELDAGEYVTDDQINWD